jgi:hypothetical protein
MVQLDAALAEALRRLSAVDPEAPDLVASLEEFARTAVLAVDSFLGVSLRVSASSSTHGFTWWVDGTAAAHGVVAPRASLAFRLPDPEGESVWVLFAGVPGAFVDLAADLSWLLGVPLDRLQVDAHVDQELAIFTHATEALLARSVVDQAVGVLIGRGLTPREALAHLDRLAERSGGDRRSVAQDLLDRTLLPPADGEE